MSLARDHPGYYYHRSPSIKKKGGVRITASAERHRHRHHPSCSDSAPSLSSSPADGSGSGYVASVAFALLFPSVISSCLGMAEWSLYSPLSRAGEGASRAKSRGQKGVFLSEKSLFMNGYY